MTTTYVCYECGAHLTPVEMARFDHICGEPTDHENGSQHG